MKEFAALKQAEREAEQVVDHLRLVYLELAMRPHWWEAKTAGAWEVLKKPE